MKKAVILFLLFILMTPVFCQVVRQDSAGTEGQRLFQPHKFNYGLNLGSEFSTISGYGSALSSYVAPSVSYNVNQRLRIGGGFSIVQTNYFGASSYFQNEQSPYSNSGFMSATIFVNGQYLVNDRLTISGSAFKQFPITRDPLPYNPFNPVSPNGAQGIDFNVGYKVGKNMYIQAGFHYSEGVNPYSAGRYYNSPFQTGGFVPGYGFGAPGW